MKQLGKFKTLISGAVLSVALLATSVSGVYAAPTITPPNGKSNSTKQEQAPAEPAAETIKTTEKLGSTDLVTTDAEGKPLGSITTQAGNVAGVDFQAFGKYCYRNRLITPIRNTTATTKSIHLRIYNLGHYRDIYTSVAAGSTLSPSFYGIDGSYSAYLYVWNGSSYMYDEASSSTNTCRVAVSVVYNTGGWVQLKIQNTGTAYAAQISRELAPNAGSGTYTGTHYDYPVAGGAAIYRWFKVDTSPYGITSYTSGSWNSPSFFTGDH